MAAALFRKILAEKGKSSAWQVESAGTWAYEGEVAAEKSQLVMAERGLDLQEHRSQVVSRNLLEGFDLILTMEKNHKEALTAELPDLSDRIYLLSEMAGRQEDVRDPIGRSLGDFEETADELDKLLAEGFTRIEKLTSGA